MTRRLSLLSILIFAALAACSGGGSSGGTVPAPVPTATPVTRYSASYDWRGSLHQQGVGALSLRRRIASGTATPEPVQLVAQPCPVTGSGPYYGCVRNATFMPYLGSIAGPQTAVVTAIVAPSPSPSVMPTWSAVSGASSDTAPIPSPDPSATPGDLTVGAGAASGVDSVTATLTVAGSPLTSTVPIYIYPSFTISGSDGIYIGTSQAVYFQAGKAIVTSNLAQADVYIDGPTCQKYSGTFANTNASETESTYHFPGGATILSMLAGSFKDAAATSWKNDFTTLTGSQLTTDIQSNLQVIEIQTHAGSVVKMFPPESMNGGCGAAYFGFDQAGSSIDGF